MVSCCKKTHTKSYSAADAKNCTSTGRCPGLVMTCSYGTKQLHKTLSVYCLFTVQLALSRLASNQPINPFQLMQIKLCLMNGACCRHVCSHLCHAAPQDLAAKPEREKTAEVGNDHRRAPQLPSPTAADAGLSPAVAFPSVFFFLKNFHSKNSNMVTWSETPLAYGMHSL